MCALEEFKSASFIQLHAHEKCITHTHKKYYTHVHTKNLCAARCDAFMKIHAHKQNYYACTQRINFKCTSVA